MEPWLNVKLCESIVFVMIVRMRTPAVLAVVVRRIVHDFLEKNITGEIDIIHKSRWMDRR